MWQKRRWQWQPSAVAAVYDKGCFALEPVPRAAFRRRSAPDFSWGQRQPALLLNISIKFTTAKNPPRLGKTCCLGFCSKVRLSWSGIRSSDHISNKQETWSVTLKSRMDSEGLGRPKQLVQAYLSTSCTSCRCILDLCWEFIIFHLYSIFSPHPPRCCFFLNTAMTRIYTSACIQLYLVIVGGAPTSLGL